MFITRVTNHPGKIVVVERQVPHDTLKIVHIFDDTPEGNQQARLIADDTIESLIAELNAWQTKNNLPHICAMEQLSELYNEEDRREELCEWLDDFITRWENCER